MSLEMPYSFRSEWKMIKAYKTIQGTHNSISLLYKYLFLRKTGPRYGLKTTENSLMNSKNNIHLPSDARSLLWL